MGSLLKSTLNTRTLLEGSYRYVRSDFPGKITDEEVRWLREQNIMTVVDLRAESEYTKRPCRLEEEEGFRYYHLPVTGGDILPTSLAAVIESYQRMIDARMDEIVDTIMNAETNVIYFCAAGKDRTGVVSAIILKKLGFSDEEIIADYMQSKDNLVDLLKALCEEHPEFDRNVITPNEDNIKGVLAVI